MGDTGPELREKSGEIEHDFKNGAKSGALGAEVLLIFRAWPHLTDAERESLLAVVRSSIWWAGEQERISREQNRNVP